MTNVTFWVALWVSVMARRSIMMNRNYSIPTINNCTGNHRDSSWPGRLPRPGPDREVAKSSIDNLDLYLDYSGQSKRTPTDKALEGHQQRCRHLLPTQPSIHSQTQRYFREIAAGTGLTRGQRLRRTGSVFALPSIVLNFSHSENPSLHSIVLVPLSWCHL